MARRSYKESLLNRTQRGLLKEYERRLEKGQVHLFAIDGLDGCGKRTLANNVSEMLTEIGQDVLIASYPTYELPFGEKCYESQHTKDLRLAERTRFLLYAFNRIETIFSIMDKANRIARNSGY